MRTHTHTHAHTRTHMHTHAHAHTHTHTSKSKKLSGSKKRVLLLSATDLAIKGTAGTNRLGSSPVDQKDEQFINIS